MSHTTSEIRMLPREMLKVLMLNYSGIWMAIAIGGAVILCIGGALIDIRIWVLALMWIFILVPLLIAFLYFNYGMMPLTALNCIPHILTFKDSEIEVKIKNHDQELKSESEQNEDSKNKYLSPDHNDYERHIVIQLNDFSYLKSGGEYVILFFHPKNRGWLWLPVSAFPSIEDFHSALKHLTNKVSLLQEIN